MTAKTKTVVKTVGVLISPVLLVMSWIWYASGVLSAASTKQQAMAERVDVLENDYKLILKRVDDALIKNADDHGKIEKQLGEVLGALRAYMDQKSATDTDSNRSVAKQ